MGKRWVIREGEQTVSAELAAMGLPSALIRILAKRGFCAEDEVREFLNPDLDRLTPAMAIPGMAEAVGRVRESLRLGEPIVVYGDYDADGVTSTVLMTTALEGLGATVTHYLPNRLSEGYGMNEGSIRELAEQGCRLIVTVDTGIGAKREIELASELGVDVIVTDHHELPDELPVGAVSILNPKVGGWPIAASYASGVGVAFKLVQGLHEALGVSSDVTYSYLDLVALGTVADVVPLKGDNRIVVAHGLRVMAEGKRPGLVELAKVSGVELSSLNEQSLGFALAPRINAAGRLSDPKMAASLLLAESSTTAARLARMLDDENKSRQEQEKSILQEALEQAEGYTSRPPCRALVLASPEWHQGVIGIVASRLVERYHRPVIMLSVSGGVAKGSGRSLPGFNLAQALSDCSGLLSKYGGHECAAGLSLPAGDIDEFRVRFTAIADASLSDDSLRPVVEIDDELAPEEATMELARELEALAPFGTGNPRPVFMMRGLWPASRTYVGVEKNHLKLKLRTRGLDVDAVGFNMPADRVAFPEPAQPMDAAFTLELNRWAGREVLQMGLRDIRLCSDGLDSGDAIGAGFVRLYGRLDMDDRRRVKDKKGVLRWVLESGEPALVYLKGDGLVANLASSLVREWPHKAGRVEYYHQGQPTADLGRQLASGECDILVTTQPLPPGYCFPGLRHIILYHLCSTYAELRGLLALASGSSQVTLHMVYGDGDASRQLDSALRVGYNGPTSEVEGFIRDMQRLTPAEIARGLWAAGSEGR